MQPPKRPELATEYTRKWWRSPGVVYFVAAGNPAVAVKIGMSAQTGSHTLQSTLRRRLSQIQTSNHEQVELIGVRYFTEGEYPTRDAEIYERQLHLEFSALQRFKPGTRGHEWFSVSEELIDKIHDVSVTPESVDAPRFYSAPVNEAT